MVRKIHRCGISSCFVYTILHHNNQPLPMFLIEHK
ncbi:hypothetical protein E2C01_056016 [Portunus trituberculatus]|uniref:Uncharacterized protein n=1 Tax=Portunus trituberculatus TaxID=210409 RepID=A0A5B7GWR5_PORTR|nr:hypothetical protein [Portunus trituberculatus]